jgi:glucose 1-dehydrogenase
VSLRVAITGVSGDLGQAMAALFRSSGALVAGCDRVGDGEGLDHFCHVDLAQPDQISAWIEALTEQFGVPDVVIANAGVVVPQSSLAVTREVWDLHLSVNLSGAFWVAQGFAQRMREARVKGHLVFIGSWVADRVNPTIPAYCISKAGLRMVMRAFARELAPDGIRVNEVAPGNVDAGLSAAMFREDPPLREACREMIPNQMLMTADEVAQIVFDLVKTDSPHVTGSVILADGGLSLT